MSLLALAASESPKVHLTSQTRIVAAVLALAFMALILELIRRDRLQERYSVVWFVAGLGMLVGAAFPGLLSWSPTRWACATPTSPSSRSCCCFLLGLALNFSVIMSRQAAQITRLAQERALEKARGRQPRRATVSAPVNEQPLEPEEERLEG